MRLHPQRKWPKWLELQLLFKNFDALHSLFIERARWIRCTTEFVCISIFEPIFNLVCTVSRGMNANKKLMKRKEKVTMKNGHIFQSKVHNISKGKMLMRVANETLPF